MPYEQMHGAFSILKQIGILSPDGTNARAVKNVMKLIANERRRKRRDHAKAAVLLEREERNCTTSRAPIPEETTGEAMPRAANYIFALRDRHALSITCT